MITRNSFGAAALAAALVFAPITSAAARAAAPRASVRQDDAPSQAEQDIFNRGRALFAKGQYEQAATVFRDFLKGHPESFIADLMLLWLGRSYIELGRYEDADQVAQRLRTIKDTPFVDIYESELTAAKRDRTTSAVAATPRAAATPIETAVVRPTPTPTPTRRVPALVRPAPTPTPTQVASANTSTTTPGLSVRGEGDAQRPRTARERPRRNSRREPANSSSLNANASGVPTTTPTPRPTSTPRTETATNVSRPTTTSTPAPTPAPRAVETPTPVVNSVQASPGEGQSGFSITVTQVPDLQLALRRTALAAQPGQVIQLPLVITNSGNKEDQFRLETDLPAEYQPSFSQSGNDVGLPVFVTPTMQRGASIEVTLNARVPESAPDNQQQRFLVRAASQADALVTKVSDASLTVVAAALAAASNALQENVQPGDTFTQRISVRNAGSATARQTRADFVFNPDFELVNASPAPISYDRPSRTAIWSLGDLESRDNREITVTLRAVSEALAGPNKPVGRGTMRTQSLFIPSNFDGPAISVGRVAGARVDAVSKGLTATPGDTIYIPFMVRNPSNYSESFELRIVAPGAPQATVYADSNGDGRHQDAEPAVTQTAALDPRGGQYPVLLGVQIPRTTADRTQFAYNLVTRAMNAGGRVAGEDSTVLTVATPRVRVRAELPNTEVKPGDTIFYRLVLVNDGGGLARSLNLTEVLPDALEFISSSPELQLQDLGGGSRGLVWRVAELAPGDTQVLQVTVRLKQGIPANAVITPRHTLTYQDSNSNAYRGQ
ncbi:MAG TPA: tetratricopeptide repeat protein [Pyrinomonadaceae bacterium]|nr:tetratricopeptide repeat protein [Pyrinomonadaceae bacterium]